MFKQTFVPKERAGFLYLGGCGTNLGKVNVSMNLPQNQPRVNIRIANTDARHLYSAFGEKSGDKVAAWSQERGRLSEFQIGGTEVAKGKGSGADLAVGFRAANTAESRAWLEAFLRENDLNLIVAGLGKGTGTTASQVAAEICGEINNTDNNDERKINLAVMVMPQGTAGFAEIAIPAHEKIASLMPVITVSNSKIKAYAQKAYGHKLDEFTIMDANQGIHEEVIQPISDIFLENTENVGEIASDRNDLKTALKQGKFVYVRSLKLKEAETKSVTPNEVASRLFQADFQDVDVAKSGKIAMLWCIGYPWLKMEMLSEEIGELATEYNPDRKNTFRILPSYRSKATEEGTCQIILMVVSDNVKKSKDEAVKQKVAARAANPAPDEFALFLDKNDTVPATAVALNDAPKAQGKTLNFRPEERGGSIFSRGFGLRRDQRSKFGEISYRVNGEVKHFASIPLELVEKFQNLQADPESYSEEERVEICRQIRERTKIWPAQEGGAEVA